jgi:hypothetical protein
MAQAIVKGAAVVLEYSLTAFLAFRGFAERYRDGIEILSSGLMFGSGAVMPPLSPESLGLGGWYKAYFFSQLPCLSHADGKQYDGSLDLRIRNVHVAEQTRTRGVISHQQNHSVRSLLTSVDRNAPWALAGLSVISILAILVSRLSLETFKPFVPFAIATGLIVTIKIVPRVVRIFRPENRPFHDEIRLAEQGNQFEGSDRASIGSSRSGRNVHGVLDYSDPWNALLLSHMDHTGLENNVRRIPSSVGSVSSIDPDFRLEDASSAASVDSSDPLL